MPRRIRTPVGLVLLTAICAASFLAAANQAPVARIAAYRNGSGLSVTFDGSGSTDSGGQIVRYQWLFGDGTTGSGSPVTHDYAQATSYTVTLLVGDDGGATNLVTQTFDITTLPSQAGALTASAPLQTAAANLPVGNGIGQRAPEIALPNLNTEGMVHLSSYLGHPVLVEFWLSTCPGCQASTPQVDQIREAYASQGLVVMLVVLDRNPSDAVSYLQRYGYRNFVLAWESDATRPTMIAYGVVATPTAFLIDRTGVIRYSGHPSGLTDDFIKRWL